MTFCHVLQCYLECFFPRNSFDSYYKLPATLCIPYPKLMKLEGRFWLQTEKLNKQGFPCSSPWPCEMFLKYLETKLFAVWEQSPACPRPNFIFHTSTIMEIWLYTLPGPRQGLCRRSKSKNHCLFAGMFLSSGHFLLARAAMGHNCMSSAESPPHLLALSHGSPISGAFFLPTKGRGVKACLLSYLYLPPVSGTNLKLPSKLYVKRWWQMSWVGFVIGKRVNPGVSPPRLAFIPWKTLPPGGKHCRRAWQTSQV